LAIADKVETLKPSVAKNDFKPTKMVGWYDPSLLAQSGVAVAISTIFGRHSDQRLVEALAAGQKEYYDYTCASGVKVVREGEEDLEKNVQSRDRKSIWIDYVGDVGDGWNSTYAVAYHIAQAHYFDEARRALKYKDPTGEEHEVKKGAILVFGGDEVYPTASREDYEKRLIAPYGAALRCTKHPHPDVYAIPGNHDWYDSLVSFSRLFTSRRWFGGWRTHQNRSYFALKLPQGWWLLGTDVQLNSDIDRPQVAYFEWIAEQMKREARKTGVETRIILCHAEPHWIRAELYKNLDSRYDENNLAFLERKLGRRVAVFIAGDLHHYRRHEAVDKCAQKITAGGGGAFLHPTHYGLLGVKLDEIEERPPLKTERRCEDEPPRKAKNECEPHRIFLKMAAYPGEKESSRQCWRNLLFPYNEGNASRGFGILTAILYLLITLSLIVRPNQWKGNYELGSITAATIHTVYHSPFTLLWVLTIVLGFLLFTDTHSNLYRVLMGGLHAIAHVLAAFAIAVLAIYAVANSALNSWIIGPRMWAGYPFTLDFRIPLVSLLVLVGGFLAGPFIMGLYLLVSMNVFGRHSNEAFSSIAVQDWKHFLKLHVEENGDLTIYPVGIKRVPRKWTEQNGENGPELAPAKGGKKEGSKPRLIEPPVKLERSQASETGVRAAD
jgi:hypothetical protein